MDAVEVPDDCVDLHSWLTPGSGWTWKAKQLAVASRSSRQSQGQRLYALISTFEESDVIEAQVKNCLRHGCDRVYLLDNGSTDDTVSTAVAAGASEVRVWHTDFYMEERRIKLINDWMREIVEREKHDCLWFLTLDADELICPPWQETLRTFLSYHPPEVNTICCHAFDHYPTEKPEAIPGFHPAEFMPYGWIRGSAGFCSRGAWKHPMCKYTRGVFDMCQSRGLHLPFVQPHVKLVEPQQGCLLHHVPFREETATRERLRRLCAPKEELGGHRRTAMDDKVLGDEGNVKRFKSLDLVYSQRWEEIPLPHAQDFAKKVGVDVRHWSTFFSGEAYTPLTWYTPAELDMAQTVWKETHGQS